MVRRILRSDNLLAIRKRKFVATTDSAHGYTVYPNLAQYLQIKAINQLWVADITYLRLGREFVYLAVVLDVFSRRVVGWSLGRSLQGALPLAALNKAIADRQPGAWTRPSFRSRIAVCQQRIREASGASAYDDQHEPARAALGERLLRELYRHTEKGANLVHSLFDDGRVTTEHRRIH